MKPELSRTYFEIGKRLSEPNSPYRELNGVSAAEYLNKAKTMFEEMDLQWDLEQLENLSQDIIGKAWSLVLSLYRSTFF